MVEAMEGEGEFAVKLCVCGWVGDCAELVDRKQARRAEWSELSKLGTVFLLSCVEVKARFESVWYGVAE